MFNVIRKYKNFPNSCIILHSHQQYRREPEPHLCQDLVLAVFFVSLIQIGVYFTAALLCNILMVNNKENIHVITGYLHTVFNKVPFCIFLAII